MKVMMKWTYKSSKNEIIELTSEWIEGEKALAIVEDFERTGRVKNVEFVDENNQVWTKKEFRKLLILQEDEPVDFVAYFDGGFNIETKSAGLGVVIYYKQNRKQFRKRVNQFIRQIDSNNEAEYAAFMFMLNELEELGVKNMPVIIRGDSLVVLKQLAGDWPCYEEEFNRWLDRIEEKIHHLGIVPQYEPIARKENSEADQLASQSLQGKEISSVSQLETTVE